MRNQIASMQVRKRGTQHCRIIRNHLDQSAQLRHTLRIADDTGHRRTLANSNASCHSQQQERDKRDLHLGSLHSKAVLRVDGCSK